MDRNDFFSPVVSLTRDSIIGLSNCALENAEKIRDRRTERIMSFNDKHRPPPSGRLGFMT